MKWGFREGEKIGKNGSVWRMAYQIAEDLNAPAASVSSAAAPL